MNKSDVVDVLTMVAAGDRRTVGDADVQMWHLVIGDIPKDFALSAVVAHRRDRPGVWIEPGHIAERWAVFRREQSKNGARVTLDVTRPDSGDGIERRELSNGDEQFRFYTEECAGRWRSTRLEATRDAENHRQAWTG